jgi:hypothetical protein
MGKRRTRVTLSDDLREHVRRQLTEGNRYPERMIASALVSRDLQTQEN